MASGPPMEYPPGVNGGDGHPMGTTGDLASVASWWPMIYERATGWGSAQPLHDTRPQPSL